MFSALANCSLECDLSRGLVFFLILENNVIFQSEKEVVSMLFWWSKCIYWTIFLLVKDSPNFKKCCLIISWISKSLSLFFLLFAVVSGKKCPSPFCADEINSYLWQLLKSLKYKLQCQVKSVLLLNNPILQTARLLSEHNFLKNISFKAEEEWRSPTCSPQNLPFFFKRIRLAFPTSLDLIS